MTPSTALRVFLAHSKEDKPVVLEIYYLLELDGFVPWIDVKDLLTGQNWELEIENAVRASHAVIVFISSSSTDRAGYFNKEIRLAIDVAERQPEGTIYIIPLCLDNCEPPKRLSHLQSSMLPREMVADIYKTLQASLLARAVALGIITAKQSEEMPTPWFMIKAGSPSQLRQGRYLVRGQNPDLSKYYGFAEVDKSDGEYLVTWYIAEREIKGHGQVPRGNEPIRLSVPGEYEVTFSREAGMGIYEASRGSGGIERFIPASPIIH